jgi:hypothetical protein
MKAYWGSTDIALALDGGELSVSCPGCSIPKEKPLVPIEQEAEWAACAVLCCAVSIVMQYTILQDYVTSVTLFI